MMKKLIYLLILLTSISGYSQGSSSLLDSRIAITVSLPENNEQISYANMQRIKLKMNQIVSAQGVAAVDYYSDFIAYPEFILYEKEVIDAGLSPKTIINGEFVMYVKQRSNGKLFGSISTDFKGVGGSEAKAILNGIKSVKPRNPKFTKFIADTKKRIIEYYVANCKIIISDAETLYRSRRYKEAIATIYSVPSGITNCDKTLQKNMVKYYTAYTDNICASQLQRAKSYAAANDYANALNIVKEVNPDSKCKNESLRFINSIRKEIDQNLQREYDLILKIYNDEVALEKMRIKAITEISKAYYENLPKQETQIIFWR